MSRVFLLILDSFGIGGAPDAKKYGDEGANTFVHIAEFTKLDLPNLASLGLGLAAEASTGKNPLASTALKGQWGYAEEISNGKDTPSGHWEIAGVRCCLTGAISPTSFPHSRDLLPMNSSSRPSFPASLATACLRHRHH